LHIWFALMFEWILEITRLYLLVSCKQSNRWYVSLFCRKQPQVCLFLVEQSLFILPYVPYIHMILSTSF
jgi:hypothetical protein